MSGFGKAVASLAGGERIARAPRGARLVIHATAAEAGDAFGMRETFTPPGIGPAPHTHTREARLGRSEADGGWLVVGSRANRLPSFRAMA